MLLKEILLRQRLNNKTAIKCGKETVSYNQLLEKSETVADMLNELPYVTKHIAIFLPNSIQYAVSYFGITLCNRVIIPISTEAKNAEIQSTLIYCEVNVILTDSTHLKTLKEILSNMEYRINIINVDSSEVISLNEQKNSKFIEVNGDNVASSDELTAIMLHTSGTTSNPKRVMLSHRNLMANIQSNIESLQLNSEDISLIQLPMIFGYCNTAQFLTHLYLGATIVIMHTMFAPKQFLQIVETEKITNFTTVPSILLVLLEQKEHHHHDISSLRYVCFGGGIMPTEKLRKIMEAFPTIGFVQTYGQTEASPRVTCLLPKDSHHKIGSIGRPIPHVSVKIVNEKGREVQVGEIGEIIVSGDNIMRGYYKRPDATNEVLSNGWLYTGDLAKYDEDKFMYLVGRKKNVIISGGMNIYPEELEETLLQHPHIKEVFVLKEKHELLGEVPIAKVIVYPGNIENIEEEIKKYCFAHLSRFKVPTRIIVVEQLDKTITGKVKRY